jgi:exopolysaccharide biosynthesis polyprenyl glycosylphosphotransferase
MRRDVTQQAATEVRHGQGNMVNALAEPSPLLGLPAPALLTPASGVSLPVAAPGAADTLPKAGAGAGRWREQLDRRLLLLADITALMLAMTLVPTLFGNVGAGGVALAGLPLALIVFTLGGLYDRDELRLVPSTLDEIPTLLQLTGLVALGLTILQPTMLRVTPSGLGLVALWLASLAAVAGGRLLARSVAKRLSPVQRCVLIGAADEFDRITDRLAASKARATVVAYLPFGDEHVPELRSVEAVRDLARELRAQRVIIAPSATDNQEAAELIRMSKAAGLRVSMLPGMLQVVGPAVEFDDLDGMTLLGVGRFGLSRSERAFKRAFDLIVGGLGLIVVGPVIGAIALAVKLDSKGPLFFRQVRVGRDGTHFRIFKFRSMVTHADALKEELRSLNEAGDGLFKISDDPRVTRLGGLLRRSSLDELPQIFNVLRGEMSLVGPRPLVADEDAQVIGLDRSRLHLTPGMTGPWQVMASRVPLQEMVGIDYLYVTNWSLWLDLKILLRTIWHVARGCNA